MKQFIVFLAIFPLMMAFMIQFTLQQNMDYRLELINEAVYDAKETAKIKGYFSDDEVESLRNVLSEIAGCAEKDVKIEVSDDIKYRKGEYDEREMISYRISLPAGRIIAFPFFAGVEEDENMVVYTLEDEFPSERLM